MGEELGRRRKEEGNDLTVTEASCVTSRSVTKAANHIRVFFFPTGMGGLVWDRRGGGWVGGGGVKADDVQNQRDDTAAVCPRGDELTLQSRPLGRRCGCHL